MNGTNFAESTLHRTAMSHHRPGSWFRCGALRSRLGQATVEYLLVIGVIVVALAAAFLHRELFEALAAVFNSIANQVSRSYP